MITAVRAIKTRISESISASANARVDRESGVVKNVKLIGIESKNGRLYPPAVL